MTHQPRVFSWIGLLTVSSLCWTAGAGAQLVEGDPAAGVRFTRRCLLISPNEGCAVADVNNDGQPDIVAGTIWAAGPDFIPRPLREIPEFNDDYLCNNADLVHDVDGDGWLDVVSGHWMWTLGY